MSQSSKKTRLIVYTGLLSALAIILYFFEFPVIPGLGYLKIDASDVPAAAAGVIMGPAAAVFVELIKAIVHVLIKGIGTTMGFGDIVNFVIGSALTVSYSVVFRKMSKTSVNRYLTAVIAGIVGIAAMVAAGVIGNYFIAPPYFRFVMNTELGGAALWTAIGGASILNVIKSAFVAVVMLPIIGIMKRYVPAMA
jgi:riboflavin transporter FmnP